METIDAAPVTIKRGVCSYPTYEEWKLYQSEKFLESCFSSYPTYEEWKPLANAQINLEKA